MRQILEQVRNYIKKHDMLKPGDRVVAAVSGGADSVCLLSVLEQIARELPVSLCVVHVHHGLRGPEADRDEAFVRELCETMKLPFVSARRDVASYAEEHKLSLEEAGRVLRYGVLEEAAREWDAEVVNESSAADQISRAKIAVAHHREDSVETVIHNLLRGSGLRGLSGIRPVQGRLIRPLLILDKQDILTWLEGAGLGWVEDSTNASTSYTRNLIRNRILPLMIEGVNERSGENILRAAEIFEQTDQYMERQAEKIWKAAGRMVEPEFSRLLEDPLAGRSVCAEIDLETFRQQEEILKRYLIRYMIDQVTPAWKNFTSRHYEEIAKLADRQVGARLDLPCDTTATVTYGTLQIRHGSQKRPPVEFSMEMLEFSTFSWENGLEIPKNQYTKWFDYDKIKDTLVLRGRQEGDYVILAGGGRKTVNRLMIDEKIARQDRDRIPLLAEGNHVLWVIGSRISEYYKITDQTKTVLQVIYNGGETDGR